MYLFIELNDGQGMVINTITSPRPYEKDGVQFVYFENDNGANDIWELQTCECYLRMDNILHVKDVSAAYPFENEAEEQWQVNELQRIFGDKFTPQVYEFENEEIDVEPF